MLQIVLTGGPHSGKSTLLHELEKQGGFYLVPEAAIQVIKQLAEEMGMEESLKWRESNFEAFQRRIVYLQKKQEEAVTRANAGDNKVLIDRGRWDNVAFCKLFNVTPSEEMISLCKEANYDLVFVLETIKPFSSRTETGRIEDEAQAEQVTNLLFETYQELGLNPIRIPQMPVKDRVLAVFKQINGLICTCGHTRQNHNYKGNFECFNCGYNICSKFTH